MKQKHARTAALGVAREMCSLLKPHCEQLVVAGSLRRGLQQVSDVEILYVPKLDQVGLFAEDVVPVTEYVILKLLGTVLLKRPNALGVDCWGRENKLSIHKASGIPVDLFATTPECWWNALVLRTGGKDNNLLITTTAIKRGWHWNAYGSGFTNIQDPTQKHVATSERDVYDFLELPYLEPHQRH